MLVLIVSLLVNRLGLNSRNSSKPPSKNLTRQRKNKQNPDKKAGGQPGHIGSTLKKVKKPDEIKTLKIDRRTLPRNMQYRETGFEARQVIDCKISMVVTEYRAQILEDEQGKKYVAPFPEGVSRPVQYGMHVKSNSVYMSQFQLIPYNRIQDHFKDQMNIALSSGTLYNINKQAYDSLAHFDQIAKKALAKSELIHADETGINVGGKTIWLHSASNEKWTYFYPHAKRGTHAMDAIGILPAFSGVLCHDHWKPYFKYGCPHALCNAHHLRELTRAWEQDQQVWANQIKSFLEEINKAVHASEGQLLSHQAKQYRKQYRALLGKAELECPPPDESKHREKRGRMKRSKARNLLERLIKYEDEVLRFMEVKFVTFTNNLAENDIRMTKVQQKISGCFRSMEGAYIFSRIRSYLSTCRKNDMNPSHALNLLFHGKLPSFISQ
ncbi:Mobile element protein [hydrothermal vent metagenome]|uniref:Mobile element protein n=1 Tax=hydrothermal vent metagenome TaxID=652676 RepID=A0A3B1CKU0_9ZZZZ